MAATETNSQDDEQLSATEVRPEIHALLNEKMDGVLTDGLHQTASTIARDVAADKRTVKAVMNEVAGSGRGAGDLDDHVSVEVCEKRYGGMHGAAWIIHDHHERATDPYHDDAPDLDESTGDADEDGGEGTPADANPGGDTSTDEGQTDADTGDESEQVSLADY